MADVAARVSLAPAGTGHRLTTSGIVARTVVASLIAGAVLGLPLLTADFWDQAIGLAAIYAIIGLSVNIITGHAGQISLGHQAFVGIGAFVSAFLIGTIPQIGFTGVLMVAGAAGGAMALVLGLVALRIRGLYLALLTLAFGLMAETTLFNWRAFTGGGAGAPAPRPLALQTDQAFAYFCLATVAAVLFLDWRLVKTRAGRAIVSVRNDERVAATLGINVTGYKLLAFVLGGLVAGVAGSLFAHWNQFVQAADFGLEQALVWILMAVVGGLGSRAGVVIGSAFFALFPVLLDTFVASDVGTIRIPFTDVEFLAATLVPLLGALLLLLTITLYPGGIGQQLLPIRRWLAGGPFVEHGHRGTHVVEPGGPAGSPALAEPTVEIPAVGAALEVEGPVEGSSEPTTEIAVVGGVDA
ncbi:MAG: branched-chain amino acid ABC transporter permease [Actinobacteria bacterium]|nr:branched-chain amino acid ABC transporter permease [Actinomycetota bacterium]